MSNGPAPENKPRRPDLQEDLNKRWQPTARAVRHARALLDAEPAAQMALIPIYLPGKQRSWWNADQAVKTVPGLVILAVNSREGVPGVTDYGTARNMASEIALSALRADGRGGTVSWATVYRGEDFIPVHEDIHQVEPTDTDSKE